MQDVRISIPADPELLLLLDGAMDVLNARTLSHPTRNALVPAALAFLADRSAEDAIPAVLRFPPDRPGETLGFVLTSDEAHDVSELFHHLSLTMPRGVPVIDWNPAHVLTSALVLYCEHVLAGPHLRLV